MRCTFLAVSGYPFHHVENLAEISPQRIRLLHPNFTKSFDGHVGLVVHCCTPLFWLLLITVPTRPMRGAVTI
jgi:hypothetical protein